MNPHQRRAKAEHNERACNAINSLGDYPDWVITTAFYSVLHFLEAKALPFKEAVGEHKFTITHIEDYKSLRSIEGSVHKARRKLLEERHPNISLQYRKLFDLCHLARYKNHQMSQNDADLALEWLSEIKKYCIE